MVLKRLISKRWLFAMYGTTLAFGLACFKVLTGAQFVTVFGLAAAVIGITETASRITGKGAEPLKE